MTEVALPCLCVRRAMEILKILLVSILCLLLLERYLKIYPAKWGNFETLELPELRSQSQNMGFS
jgi:hypothetical protein